MKQSASIRTGLSLAGLLALVLSTAACSESQTNAPVATAPAEAAPASASECLTIDCSIRAGLASLLPAGTTVDAIKPGPLPGLSEVTVQNRVAYVTNDGKHFVQGPIIELRTNRNLTQIAEAELHKAVLDRVGQDRRIVFPATTAEKFKVTVFTDVECGFCRELHRHLADYNAAGITVQYLMYPRGGTATTAAHTMRDVWCAADRRQALTDAKLGNAVPERECETFIDEDYALGQSIGVNGTPAIYAANAMQVGGYLSPAQLVAALEQAEQQVGR